MLFNNCLWGCTQQSYNMLMIWSSLNLQVANCIIWIYSVNHHLNPPSRGRGPAGSLLKPWPLTHSYWCRIRMSALSPAGRSWEPSLGQKEPSASVWGDCRLRALILLISFFFFFFFPSSASLVCAYVHASTLPSSFPCVTQPVGWFRPSLASGLHVWG